MARHSKWTVTRRCRVILSVSCKGSPVSRSFSDRLTSVLRSFEQGIILPHDFQLQLCLYAAYPQFFSNLSRVPKSVIPELHRFALESPAHPEDVAVSSTAIFDSEDRFQQQDSHFRLEYFWASRNLRKYFYPSLPDPVFEAQRSIGLVEDYYTEDRQLILLGTFNYPLVRNHPTTLRFAGTQTPISIIGDAWIERQIDRPAHAVPLAESKRYALIVDAEFGYSPAVRCGAELWVDRTAVSEFPAAPESS